MIRNALLIALIASKAWAVDTESAKSDLAQLQGDWAMLSANRDGTALPDAMVKSSKRVCKGDETTVVVAGQLLMKAKFTLDPTKKPKSIDYRITSGANVGKTQLGIYELDGDKVKFCFSTPGNQRPTNFVTKAGDGHTSSVWKHDKR